MYPLAVRINRAIKAYKIPVSNAQGLGLRLGLGLFINDHLGGVKGALDGLVVLIDVNRWVDQLQGSVVDFAPPGVDAAGFGLAIVGLHTAHRREAQPQFSLTSATMAPNVSMWALIEGPPLLAAQGAEDTPFGGLLGLIAQAGAVLL